MTASTHLAERQALIQEMAELYRHLHQHPELSTQEMETADRVARTLESQGYAVTKRVGGTGVVATLTRGDGPVVMLRADMDALPVKEQTGLGYASVARGTDPEGREVDVMHACGHDMHMACLLGAAAILANPATSWAGTVILIFQPAEELGLGAQAMVDDDLFATIPVPDVILAQHVGPLPAGIIAYGDGNVMASADAVHAVLHGRGGHGAMPEATVDPVVMAASTVMRLQTVVAREINPTDRAVVTVGRIHAGTKENIIPDVAELDISIRSYSAETRQRLRQAVERILHAESEASAAPVPPALNWTYSLPPVHNDPAATARAVTAFRKEFGPDRVVPQPTVMASEDVGIFGEACGAPTVFWFLGGIDPETIRSGNIPSNHSPFFAPAIHPTLETGIDALVAAAMAWLNAGHSDAAAV